MQRHSCLAGKDHGVSPQDRGLPCGHVWRSSAPRGILLDSIEEFQQQDHLFTSPAPFIKRHINLLRMFMAAFTSCIETVHLEIWFKHRKSPEFFPQMLRKKKNYLNTHFRKAADKGITSSQMWILPDFEVNLLSHP